MGFFRRLFKKTDKRREIAQQTAKEAQRLARTVAENEAETAKLLRTASSRYAVANETEHSSVLPLPHPINQVLPSRSAATLAVPEPGPRGSYTVKVYPRTRHILPEHETRTSNPSPDTSFNTRRRAATFSGMSGPATPRLLGLRQDPSVASLISMYDEHGRLGEDAFANTPPRGREPAREYERERSETPPLVAGRAQTKRTASTLRQLMEGTRTPGRRESGEIDYSDELGDISWAERFLDENLTDQRTQEEREEVDSDSADSSCILQTPLDALFRDQHLSKNSQEYTFNDKLISSLEVELSNTSTTDVLDGIPRSPMAPNSPYGAYAQDPDTPQRASEVFSFLTARGRRQLQREEEEEIQHPLPALPSSAFSDDSHGREAENLSSTFSDDSCQPHPNLTSAFSDDSHRLNEPLPAFSEAARPMNDSVGSVELSMELEALARDLLNNSDDSHQPPPPPKAAPSLFQVVVERNSVLLGPRPPTVRGPRMISPSKRITSPSKQRIAAASRTSPPQKYKSRLLQSPPKRATRTNENRGVAETPGPLSPNTRNALGERSNIRAASKEREKEKDPFTALPTRRSHTRGQMSITSFNSNQSLAGAGDVGFLPGSGKVFTYVTPPTGVAEEKMQGKRKENENMNAFSAQYPVLPMTPVHTRSVFHSGGGPTPSPASSTDLSPVGKTLMADLREQRMKGRQIQRMGGPDKPRAVPRMGVMF